MKRCLIVCCAILVAACGTFHLPTVQANEYWLKASESPPASRVESLLAYAGYARDLSDAELAREIEHMRRAFAAKDRSDFVRLQYALLLAFSGTPGRDLPRARQLLEPLLKESGRDIDLRRLATHLHAEIDELLEGERRFREEQRRANDLDQKLEALKSIERRIIQRTTPETNR